MTNWLEFVDNFWQPFWIGILEFRIQTSFLEMRNPTELLYFKIHLYLFVKWKHIQGNPSKHIDLSLFWLNSVSLSAMQCNVKGSIWKVLLFISNTQCCFDAGPLSATLGPHWNIIGYRPMYFNLINVEGDQRVQVCLSPVTKGPYWLVKNFIHEASPDMYIIAPTLIHIVIRKILNKSGRTTVNS